MPRPHAGVLQEQAIAPLLPSHFFLLTSSFLLPVCLNSPVAFSPHTREDNAASTGDTGARFDQWPRASITGTPSALLENINETYIFRLGRRCSPGCRCSWVVRLDASSRARASAANRQ